MRTMFLTTFIFVLFCWTALTAAEINEQSKPGTFNQVMANAQHNNWVEGKAVTRPKELWRKELEGSIGKPVFIDNILYWAYGGCLRGFDITTGKEVFAGPKVWEKRPSSSYMTYSVDNESIFIMRDKTLDVYDRKTGKERWSFAMRDKVPPINNGSNTPVLYKGKVFIVSIKTLYAIDSKTGKEEWSFDSPQEIASMPCVNNGIVVIGCYPTLGPTDNPKHLIWYRKNTDAKLWGIDVGTGKQLWEQANGKLLHSQNPGIWGDKLFSFHRGGGVVVKRDLKTGNPEWEFKAGVEPRSCGLSINGVFVIAGGKHNNKVYNLDFQTGKKLWTAGHLLKGYNWTPSTIVGDHIYVSWTYFYPYGTLCLQLKDKKVVWQKDGSIHCGFMGGKLLYNYWDPHPTKEKRAGKGWLVCVGQDNADAAGEK